MTNEIKECITNLIEKPQDNIRMTQKKIRRKQRYDSKNHSETYSNHRKRYHQKLIYTKPWLITEKMQNPSKASLYEEKLLPNDTEPILLPKDPVVLGRLNFRKENAQKVKKMKPRKVKERYADNRFGDTHDLISSGLIPVYINRKHKIPNYLRKKEKKDQVKKDKDKSEDDLFDQLESIKVKGLSKSNCKPISSDEREKILSGMKKRWDQLMSEYYTLPFIISTPPQIKKKSNLENALKQLEKDIDTIERHKLIFVYEDSAKKVKQKTNKYNVKLVKSQK